MIDATITLIQQWLQFIAGYALKVFTASQWMTMGLAILAVMALTEMVKQIVLWKTKGPQLVRDIYATAFLMGLFCAGIGSIVSPFKQPLWFWTMLGLMSGYVSIYIYKWVVPAIVRLILNRFPALAKRKQP